MTEPNRTITTDPEALARFASHAVAYADAREHERSQQRQLREATAARKALHARLASGDDTVTTSDLSEAHWQAERAGILLEAAGRTLNSAERKTRHADLDFGEAVAHLVQGPDLYDCRIIVTDREPAKADKRTLPILYVVQGAPTEDLGAGSIKGTAELYLYGDSRMVGGPSAEEVEQALTNAGWRLIEQAANRPATVIRHDTEEVGGGVWRTGITVKVASGGYAWHPAPRITPPVWGKGAPGDLETMLCVAASKAWGWSERTMTPGYDRTSPDVMEHSDGTLSAAMTVGVSITPTRHRTDSESYAANLTRKAEAAADSALSSLLGRFVPGMGVVSEVTFDAEPFGMAGDVSRYATVTVRFRGMPEAESIEEPEGFEDADEHDDDSDNASEDYGMRDDGLVFPYTAK